MKVSIVTVSLNSESTIRKTIESVISQTYENIEYIIVDGKSSDNTVQIIESYKNIIISKGIDFKYISESDIGIYDAINKGIRLASGDVIGILNSDDRLYSSDTIDVIVRKFKSVKCDCIYGDLVFVDRNNKIKRKWVSRPYKKGDFSKSWTPAHPTFYCYRILYEKYGFYKTDYKIASDVELMFRFLSIHELVSFHIPNILVIMQIGGISTSGFRSTLTIIKEIKKAFIENNRKLNIFKYIFFKTFKLKQFIRLK